MPDIDATVAHNARVWNYWLDGKDHFEVDRQVGDQVRAMHPSIVEVARADRAFLGRAVRYLADDAGIRQFLDIGTGLPTAENTHEVAASVRPDARVVYVDNDPIVLSHARALLTSAPPAVTSYADADARDPATLLRAAGQTLDFREPVAIVMLGILNFVLDDAEAGSIVRTLLDAVVPGSYLVLSHPTLELGGDGNAEAMRFWNENATPPIKARSGEEIRRLLAGVELVDPGLVSCAAWRPDTGDAVQPVAQYGAVGRLPRPLPPLPGSPGLSRTRRGGDDLRGADADDEFARDAVALAEFPGAVGAHVTGADGPTARSQPRSCSGMCPRRCCPG